MAGFPGFGPWWAGRPRMILAAAMGNLVVWFSARHGRCAGTSWTSSPWLVAVFKFATRRVGGAILAGFPCRCSVLTSIGRSSRRPTVIVATPRCRSRWPGGDACGRRLGAAARPVADRRRSASDNGGVDLDAKAGSPQADGMRLGWELRLPEAPAPVGIPRRNRRLVESCPPRRHRSLSPSAPAFAAHATVGGHGPRCSVASPPRVSDHHLGDPQRPGIGTASTSVRLASWWWPSPHVPTPAQASLSRAPVESRYHALVHGLRIRPAGHRLTDRRHRGHMEVRGHRSGQAQRHPTTPWECTTRRRVCSIRAGNRPHYQILGCTSPPCTSLRR